MGDDKTRQGTPTPDGERVRVSELNTGLPFATPPAQGAEAKAKAKPPTNPVLRVLHNFNQFLAGMYTGVTCHGTPHSHRPDHDQESGARADKPDNRPI